MVLVRLHTFEPGLYSLDFGIDRQVILKDQVNSVGGDPAALGHQHSLASLVKPNVRQAVSRQVKHVELLKLIERPNTNSRV